MGTKREKKQETPDVQRKTRTTVVSCNSMSKSNEEFKAQLLCGCTVDPNWLELPLALIDVKSRLKVPEKCV